MADTIQPPPIPAQSANPPPATGRSRFVHALVWMALLLVFGAAFYLVSVRKPPAPTEHGHHQMGPVTVQPATAKKSDIGVYLESIGTVTPVYTASIVNQVTGVVVAVHYQEGQLVKKGDPLIDLDSRQYDATLLQAQGTLEKDQSALMKDQIDAARYQAAFARNAVSKQILDDQEKLVKQDEGQVKNDQGLVEYDQVQVDYCHIVAPFTGRVGLRLVDPGNLVTAGGSATPLVVVAQLQPITVIFTISEDNLGGVQEQLARGAKLGVEVFDRTAQTKIATGEVLALDNQIDTTTGTVKVRASFPNDDLRLFPNQFVNTRLLVKTIQGATLIPSSAIQQNGQSFFVYVLQDGMVHQRTVKPGVTDNGQTQVDGINPGDQIADSSFDKLEDGDKVNMAGQGGSGHGEGHPAAGGTPGDHPGNHQGGHGGHRQGGGGSGGSGSGT